MVPLIITFYSQYWIYEVKLILTQKQQRQNVSNFKKKQIKYNVNFWPELPNFRHHLNIQNLNLDYWNDEIKI
jgi:hypothetical protein